MFLFLLIPALIAFAIIRSEVLFMFTGELLASLQNDDVEEGAYEVIEIYNPHGPK